MGQIEKIVATAINEYLNEQIGVATNSIKDILIKRIPFLKEYDIYEHPRDEKRLEGKRIVFNKNVKVMMGDEMLTFPQYNVSSSVIYYPHTIYDNTFHNFIVKNQFHVLQPEEMDNLTYTVFIKALNYLEKSLSYNKELIVANNEDIPKEELDKIVNEMNGILFKIEEFTEKQSINLF